MMTLARTITRYNRARRWGPVQNTKRNARVKWRGWTGLRLMMRGHSKVMKMKKPYGFDPRKPVAWRGHGARFRDNRRAVVEKMFWLNQWHRETDWLFGTPF